jgi:ribosome recycling factor
MSDSIKERMEKTVDALRREWTKIRTGMATASILDHVMVDYYGSPTPVSNIAKVSNPEPRVLAIAPWEKNMLGEIEKAILMANIGLTPTNDGSFIRLTFPILTTERRQELVKQVKKMAEESKVAIRNIRRDENESLKKNQKDLGLSDDDLKGELDDVQKVTDVYIAMIDKLTAEKEQDVLKV